MTQGITWQALESPALRVLSWGAGVQSTTLAVMSAIGDLQPLDVVIFSDTQWERQETYDIVRFYKPWLEQRGIRVEIVTIGNIFHMGAQKHIHLPFWTSNGGPLRRQCTREFKIRPVRRRIRELMGYPASKPPHPPRGSVEQWIGFSWDEAERMKGSQVQFILNRHPLLERKITRDDCQDYLKNLRLPIPGKSACVGCPYRTASEWQQMSAESPEEFSQAIEFDNGNRHNPLAERGSSSADELYIYKHGVPLVSANLAADAKRERKGKQLPLFLCDGPCYT